MRKSLALTFTFLIVTLLALNYSFFTSLSSQSGKESAVVARVIDGDTLVLKDGRTLRLLNINTPEKNSPLSISATEFLQTTQNRSIEIEITGIDKYGRSLARIYDRDYLNLALVQQGFSSKFLVQESELSLFAQAEKNAIEQEKGMWKHSDYYGCFSTDIDKKTEVVHFTRTCNISSMKGWIVKDESRKTYSFSSTPNDKFILSVGSGKDTSTELFWDSKTSIWNNDRDSLYMFDEDYNIVHYHSYGY